MKKIKIEVNGTSVEKEVPDNTLLSTFLREHLNLTGTHIGCDTICLNNYLIYLAFQKVYPMFILSLFVLLLNI